MSSLKEALTPPQGWPDAIAELMGIDLWRIPIVMGSAVLIYLAFLLFVRVFGQRVLTSTSSFDAVVTVMFGSVAGRVVIGHPPTVATGIIGLLTLILLERIFGAIRSWFDHLVWKIEIRPLLIVTHGEIQEERARKAGITYADIAASLRRSGLSSLQQVYAMVLESNGTMSIITEGARVDPEIFAGVEGAESLGR